MSAGCTWNNLIFYDNDVKLEAVFCFPALLNYEHKSIGMSRSPTKAGVHFNLDHDI